ncbi:MAG: ATP-binding cassette domain-containing protein [Tissierellia bacterium]|nr:ATP-binding cassette domain-containing protein [Tissierellia bacterium]
MKRTLKQWILDFPFVEDYLLSIDLDFSNKMNLSYEEALKSFDSLELEEASILIEDELKSFQKYIKEMSEFLGWSSGNLLQTLTILPGRDKDGKKENFSSLVMKPSEIISVVGPTGSGKSRFLQDIEWVAKGDTPTGRKVLIDDEVPDPSWRTSPHKKLVAQLSQNMNFVMDLSVKEFLILHGNCRQISLTEDQLNHIISSANTLAGEEFSPDTPLTSLSGGQSRALMIADTVEISTSPVILLDEIENAGIDRKKALDLFVDANKILLIATHDPILALMADRRIVINNGGIKKIINTTNEEKEVLEELTYYDDILRKYRNDLRLGHSLSMEFF